MRNRTNIRSLVFAVLLLALPLYCFAEYKVVIKKNGKIIEGKLAAEDETSVTIISRGTRLRYKKDTLDLDKMKELNADYAAPSDVRTMDRPSPSEQPQQETTSLADVARQSRASNNEVDTEASDSDERALVDFLAELEEKVRMQATQESQIQLSKTKKALSHYRSQKSSELSTTDRRLMLEQLVEALDRQYRRALENGAPDDKIATLKRKIENARQKLSDLE